MLIGRLQGHRQPRILRGSRQQAKARRPPGRNPARILAKETAGSAKNITPNRENNRSARPGFEGIDSRVGAHETCRGAGGDARPRPLQHWLGKVEAERMAARADAARQFDRRRAAAAANIERALARRDFGVVEQHVRHRRQHDVLHFLTLRPVAPGWPVPVSGRVGVSFVRREISSSVALSL